MASSDVASLTESEPASESTGHEVEFGPSLVATAAPVTDYSTCRTGVVSDLLLQCGEGDAEAFSAILDIFYWVVQAATARRLPVEDVEEAVQGTFVAIWREAPCYRPGGGTTAVEWVMGHVVPSATDLPRGGL